MTLLLAGCAGLHTPAGADAALPAGQHELVDVPFFPQQTDQCGPAALATVLGAAAKPTSAQALAQEIYLPARGGSLQIELEAAARARGLLVTPLPSTLDAITQELNAGRPVLVLQNLGLPAVPTWHYAVVVGYDGRDDVLILRSGTTPRLRMPRQRFLRTWHWGGRWARVITPPAVLPLTADERTVLRAATALEESGQPQAALLAFEAARRRWPASSIAAVGHGNAAFALGRRHEAAQAFAAALQHRPDEAVAANNLAWLLAGAGCEPAARALLASTRRRLPAADPRQPALAQTERELPTSRLTCPSTPFGLSLEALLPAQAT